MTPRAGIHLHCGRAGGANALAVICGRLVALDDVEPQLAPQIADGPFKNYEGTVDSVDVDKGKLTVLVLIFDRETPVELDFTQVKKK